MTVSPQLENQYQALTQGVGVAELAARTRLEIRGADRAAFLHSFCSNDVKGLTPGRGCEAFITGPQGKTLGHGLIFCEPERLLLDTSPGQATGLIAHFNKYLISEDVEFHDRTADTSVHVVAGEQSVARLAALTGEPPVELLASQTAAVAGRPLVLRKVEYAGPACYFLEAAADDAPAVMEALLATGAAHCGPEALEAARVSARFPLYGRDITEDNLPQEVGRDAQAISFTKGCYLGQETVARIDALGHVNRLLVSLRLSGDRVPTTGAALLADGKPVGHITSAAWSPALNAPLALGYVRRALAKPGSMLSSDFGPVEVVGLPITAH